MIPIEMYNTRITVGWLEAQKTITAIDQYLGKRAVEHWHIDTMAIEKYHNPEEPIKSCARLDLIAMYHRYRKN